MAFGIKERSDAEISGTGGLNLIGRGTVITGDINSASNLRIEGEINGNITCQDTITIAASGIVKGNVSAKTVILGGKITGNLDIREKIMIESKGVINGEIRTRRLIVEEGAIFDGKCLMAQTPKEHGLPEPKTKETA